MYITYIDWYTNIHKSTDYPTEGMHSFLLTTYTTQIWDLGIHTLSHGNVPSSQVVVRSVSHSELSRRNRTAQPKMICVIVLPNNTRSSRDIESLKQLPGDNTYGITNSSFSVLVSECVNYILSKFRSSIANFEYYNNK